MLLRGFDATLNRRVYWQSSVADGSQYTGPGPLSDIVVKAGGGEEGLALEYQSPPPNGPPPADQFQMLAITPDGLGVFVGSQDNISYIWKIDTATNKWHTATPPTPPYIGATLVKQMVVHPSGTKMYILPTDGSVIYVANLSTYGLATVSAMPGGFYTTMAIQPGTNELWVHNGSGPGEIDRVNTTTDTFISSFTAATFNAYDMKFNPSGSKMYYVGANTLSFAPRFHIYNATTHTLITSISDTPLYRSIVALPSGSEVWVAIDGAGPPNSSLVRYSTTTDAVVGSPILTSQDAGGPFHMVAKPDSSKVYALLNSGDIDVVSVSSHTIIDTIAMSGNFAGDMIINPAGTRIYASKTQGTLPYWVKAVDLSTDTIIATITADTVTIPSPTFVGEFDSLRIVGAHLADDTQGQGSITLPIAYDLGSTAYSNLKAVRAAEDANQNDQNKKGITNLGSGGLATEDYSTIGGGQSNKVSGNGATVPGGIDNDARGQASFAAGFGSLATAEGSSAMNAANSQGPYSHSVNYGAVQPNAEACTALNDGFVDDNTYGSVAENGASMGTGGNYNHAEGGVFIDNNAQYAHGEGRNGYIAAGTRGAHVEGNNGDVEADYGHVEGTDCTVNGEAGHAEGSGCEAGLNAHAEGVSTTASGWYSHAQGGATLASAEGAHAEGDGSQAVAKWTHAQGSKSNATRETQFAHGGSDSGGFGSGSGAAQTSWLQLRRHAIAGPSNSAPLIFGPSSVASIVLEDNRAYDFTLTAVVNGTTTGPVFKTRAYRLKFNARCVSGTATIVASGASEDYGDAATWTFTLSTSTNTIIITFNTGTDSHTCYVSAKLEFVETRFS